MLSSGDCHLTCIVLQVAFLRLIVRSILNKKLCLLDPVIRPSRTVGAVNSFWSPCRAHAADWESYFKSGLWLVAATETQAREMWNPLACIPYIELSNIYLRRCFKMVILLVPLSYQLRMRTALVIELRESLGNPPSLCVRVEVTFYVRREDKGMSSHRTQ